MMLLFGAESLWLRRSLLQNVPINNKLLFSRGLLGRGHQFNLIFILLVFRIPVLRSLSDLFLRANHFEVSRTSLLVRGLVFGKFFLSSTNNLNKICSLVRGFSVGPLLPPLLHGIFSNLLSFQFFLKLVLRAVNSFCFNILFFMEILGCVNNSS
jgi:hypothetical protein